ncbi:hypothetical protein [Streptomyces sp. NPDC018045]|uniref:hypothetical protein n=1 Tax=Streptomyces sp. NPDC018045 TaxID=3365037 RepID=UPI0037A8F4DC
MTAVSVEIAPIQPSGTAPYATRPVAPAAAPVTTITAVPQLDDVMDSAMCSCQAGDDNPH